MPLPNDLHPALPDALRAQGIGALYTHQARAWQQLGAGHNPVVVTATASGKTLCYNLPVLDRLLHDPQARALYLFPTKALAHDQKQTLLQFIATFRDDLVAQPSAVPVATYDGDTPTGARPAVRTTARLVISNPDMLHTGVLPHHTLWAEFFQHLQFVILFGMNTADHHLHFPEQFQVMR